MRTKGAVTLLKDVRKHPKLAPYASAATLAESLDEFVERVEVQRAKVKPDPWSIAVATLVEQFDARAPKVLQARKRVGQLMAKSENGIKLAPTELEFFAAYLRGVLEVSVLFDAIRTAGKDLDKIRSVLNKVRKKAGR